MDSTVIGEDIEMQVVVVTHNVLPIRSLRWQNIPSSLPVKCKVYSCGRVRHKRGQQNSSKCLDKGIFYPYIRYVSILLHSSLHSWSFYPPHSWSSGRNTFGDYLRISAMRCAVGSVVLTMVLVCSFCWPNNHIKIKGIPISKQDV